MRFAGTRVGRCTGTTGTIATGSRCCTGKTSRNHPTAPATIIATPTALTTTLVTSPMNAKPRPNAAIMGHAVGAGICTRSIASPADHVDGEEHDDPHAIHEVPVPGEELRPLRVAGGDVSAKCEGRDKSDQDKPDRDVRRMQPDERVVGRAEQIGPDRHPASDEPSPLSGGADEEAEAE